MRIDEVAAYEQISNSEIKEINSHARLLRHKKTGARVVLIENDDENKVFYIGFRTPPKESTGVMHILEHSVLCGSKQFPVKDPFIELAKGSLNTFLNAMTYPDKTVYPVASCNDKDFQNLLHVYLDAVLYPNIYNHDMTFRQEGWHYEMESIEDELTINGVVYNEMKGAFSSPDDVLEREIFNTLFPDTPYSEESGGDPKVIPELTYEHYLEVHRQYYHPSNSYIYLYGNMDMAEKLQFIDEQYLSAFERLEIDSQIPIQKAFDKPIEVKKYFSVTESEPLEDNTYLSYNCVTNDCLDRKKYIAFQVLDYALCATPGAVLKQALLDAGIGKDIYSFYDNGIRQPYFSVVAKNAEGTKKEEFLAIIRNVLTEITEKGFDKDTLRAGLNYYEFKYREADFGSYPPGLMYGLQILDSWLYDDNKPFIHLAAEDTFAALREDIETDYYERLLKEALLDNTHCSVVVVEPKRNLVEQEEKQLKEKLAAYKDSLSKEEIVLGDKKADKKLSHVSLIIYFILFVVSILTVLKIIPDIICLAITLIVVLTVNRKLLLKVDYSLLFTFIFFFIFVGNAGCIEAIRNFISEIVIGREIIVAAFLSQGLSNVPATVMLAGFTDNAIDLLKGVTLGGLGTPIASMASLITYKFYVKAKNSETGRYMKYFLLLNFAFMFILMIFALNT